MRVETREDALLHCFDLWLWLAVTGGKSKVAWPGWNRNGGYLENNLHDCPVCEYARQCCNVCIIPWGGNGHCNKNNAEYDNWEKATTKQERIKWALKIAALALDAL